MKEKYTIFETFVGAGGSHLGFKNNNFKSIFVNDIDPDCIKTLLYNNPEIEKTAKVSIEDFINLKPAEILKSINMKKKEIDVMFGGIVCKGFSLAGEKSPNDKRNFYYRQQLYLVKEIMPKISIIENVPGIIKAEIIADETPQFIEHKINSLWKELENYKGFKANARKNNKINKSIELKGIDLRKKKDNLIKYLKENKYLISVKEDIEKIYEKIGYRVYEKVLNSAWYGAYTKRERIIIVAVRKDIDIEFEYPKPLYVDEKDFKTVGEALSLIKKNEYDSDNIPMKHNPKTVSRLQYIKEGENLAEKIDDLPDDLKISKFYSRGSTMRLDSKKSSPTLVPGHSNFPIHPFEDRSITVREAATITGFPLDYKFFGSHSKRCEEVGNAVPPPLSTVIAKQCKKLLDKYYKNKELKKQKYKSR